MNKYKVSKDELKAVKAGIGKYKACAACFRKLYPDPKLSYTAPAKVFDQCRTCKGKIY